MSFSLSFCASKRGDTASFRSSVRTVHILERGIVIWKLCPSLWMELTRVPICMWCIGFRRILPTERRALPINGILQHKSKAITRLMDLLKKDEPPSRRVSGSKHLRLTNLILGRPKIVSLSLTSAWFTSQGSRPVMANRTSVQDPVPVDTRWRARSWFKTSDLKFSDRSSLTTDLSF